MKSIKMEGYMIHMTKDNKSKINLQLFLFVLIRQQLKVKQLEPSPPQQ